MDRETVSLNRPLLKSRGLSTHHVEIFEMILMGKSTKEINQTMGYSERSHAGVDHSRKVMYKLLVLEGLCRKDYLKQVAFPRQYYFWWKNVLCKHVDLLMKIAIKPEYYTGSVFTELVK